MPRNRSSRAREMQRVIRKLESSRKSIRAFAKETGIPESTLSYWRRRVRELEETVADQATFLPVTVVPDPRPSDALTVELRGGRRLLVPSRFEEDDVRRLITVIESC